jgi:hypothetical protein
MDMTLDGWISWTDEGVRYRTRSRSPRNRRTPEITGLGRISIPERSEVRPVVLMSLFDGLGTARLAMDELIRIAGPSVRLVASWYAEWCGVLRGGG